MPLTPEIISSLPAPADPQISPDGTRVAWTVGPMGHRAEHPERGVWLATLAALGSARPWTSGHDDTSPRWSPDGTRIAFLSDRAKRGKTHGLYVLDVDGGEASPLVVRKRSVGAFVWSPDGQRLAFLAPGEPTEEEERREKERDDADVFGEHRQLAQLWTIGLDGGEPEVLWSPDGRHLTELAWSPDGSRLAVLSDAGPLAQYRTTTQIGVVPAGEASGDLEPLATVPMASGLGWCRTDTLVFNGFHDHEAQGSATLWAVAASGGSPPRVVGTSADEPRCTIGLAHVPGGERVVAQIAEGLTNRLELLDPETGAREVAAELDGDLGGMSATCGESTPIVAAIFYGEGAVGQVLAGPANDLALVHDHASDRDQVEALEGLVLSAPEQFHAVASDGTALDSVVIRPVGPDVGPGPWPTAVLLHGGPYSRSGPSSHTHPLDWAQLLVTHGYAVVMPNYRGGLGHGHDFATQARGTMGSVEWDDVLAVVDAAVEAGIADPDRLGIGGWSQGGFLTAWAVTGSPRPDLFKVGVMGAGVSDWSMMAATSDLPDFEAALGGSRPWDGVGPHQAAIGSPLSYAARRTTPLLILHGAEDKRVPLSQATAFHRALAEQEAPLELVTYPREPHGIREWHHQVDVQRRVLEWFDRYLR